jgi:hypothetical protein
MRRLGRRAATLALAAAGVVAIYGCTERLEGGRACPILCPGQNVELRDTVIAAVALDASLPGYPAIGEEPLLLLTARGDTIDTRVIVRYDTLPSTYQQANSPTPNPIEAVRNAVVTARMQFPTPYPDRTVTIEAYDVDTAVAGEGAPDTAAATMVPLFRPDRFIGSVTFRPTDITGGGEGRDSTVRIPIDDAYLFGKIQTKARLRVGLVVRGAESAELVLLGSSALRSIDINFDVPVEPVVRVVARPYSATPSERFLAPALSDFVIVAHRRAPDTPAEVLAVGGVPGKRTYLRFDLPPGIVDSMAVVRATLLLTQYPNRLAAHGPDSVSVYPSPLGATPRVTDLAKAVTFLFTLQPLFQLDSLRAAPDDSGAVAIEVGGAVQVWRSLEAEQADRALVLRAPNEGVGQDELYFFSTRAAASLRPRLRIVYVPRVGFGLP